jgi:TolA-binding protein
LRGVDALARVYDAILEARFDQIDAELRKACGPAPQEACDVLAATAAWWQILVDPQNRRRDAAFSTSVDRAIRMTEAWTEREPDEPEAWFYRGAAYAARVQWRVLRNEKLSAARDGKRIKQSLERAVQLDPSLDDAFFGIGMYKYYADVAPAAARILRFLLLLPGGDRREGLAQMLRARTYGRLLQGEADYQLHVIYLWYERQTGKALDLLRSLNERYPGNPLFLAQIAEIQDAYQHDIGSSLENWRRLLALARDERVNEAPLAEAQARLGIARQVEALHLSDEAIEQLQAVITAKADAPYSALSLAYLRLGEAHDRLGARTAAVAAYRSAAESAPLDDVYEIRQQAAERQRRVPDARRADAYRLSLYGWRRLEHNDLQNAGAALERSLELNPDDPVARYRYGRVLEGRKNDGAALAQFEATIRAYRSCPAPVLADAYLEAARLVERGGARARAIAYYRLAANTFGSARETRAAATRALTRLAR